VYVVQEKVRFNFQRLHFFSHPYFCPFLLLEYNKEAGKNIAYTRTLYEMPLNFMALFSKK
jgi:hypothetical protein